MKNRIRNLNLMAGQINQRHVRISLAVLSLVLFVLGAGAPEAGGDFGG
jgi:hypothetical protein